MDKYLKNSIEAKIEMTIEGFKRNNINAFYIENKKDVISLILNFIKKSDVISLGGSVTLQECGILDYFEGSEYDFLNQYESNLNEEQIKKIYIDSFHSDVYISSANAITLDGLIYNVDGKGNRVAALTYGPESVIIIVGYNKIVNSIDAAIDRVKCIAGPSNCIRLNKKTYCSKTGTCIGLNKKITEGCDSVSRICRNYSVIARQSKSSDRIKVVIVGEELGY